MGVLDERMAFKPFQYQWAYQAWLSQQNAHWLHTEIPMSDDVTDWELNLSDAERNTIGNILKGFTQTETEVGSYWSSLVPTWFPVPEIKMMAQTFAAFETIHANAYAHLNDTLKLDNFEEFLSDEATMEKLGQLISIRKSDQSKVTPSDIARSLAVFSACAEGINLFSSFAVLLSFRKSNRLKGIGQQIIFSVKDESLHSESGCKLFRVMIEEYPEIWTENLRKTLYEAVELSLTSEFTYINKIFEMGDLETITKAQLKNFMNDRANRKLIELNLSPRYLVDAKLLKEMDWFYITVSGEIQTDFFAGRETGYSKPNEDWAEDDLFS